jgi:hypothetical protein
VAPEPHFQAFVLFLLLILVIESNGAEKNADKAHLLRLAGA